MCVCVPLNMSIVQNGTVKDFKVTLCCQMDAGELVPLLIAAGGGGNAYLEDPESSLEHIPLEQYENSTVAPSANGQTGAAGTTLFLDYITTNADLYLF